MSKSRHRQSKRLSYILRHRPDTAGLTLDSAGWVSVEELLRATKMSRGQLEEIVRTNDKKRFEISGERIRAVQGHSLEVNLQYEPSDPPATLFHGTASRFLAAIEKEGLRPMTRQHVHLSATVETATTVGRRHGKPVIVGVRAKEMVTAGHEFFLATNGVWLTEEVPVAFLGFPGVGS